MTQPKYDPEVLGFDAAGVGGQHRRDPSRGVLWTGEHVVDRELAQRGVSSRGNRVRAQVAASIAKTRADRLLVVAPRVAFAGLEPAQYGLMIDVGGTRVGEMLALLRRQLGQPLGVGFRLWTLRG